MGSADDDVSIVGRGEDALHFDGDELTAVPLGRGNVELLSLSGTAANDVWAVGRGVLHWDGTTWTEMTVPGVDPEQVFSDVWAVAPNDVFVVNAPDVSHFDGALWTTTRAVTDSIAFLLAVWSSGNDAWASGETSVLLRLRAGSWVPSPCRVGRSETRSSTSERATAISISWVSTSSGSSTEPAS